MRLILIYDEDCNNITDHYIQDSNEGKGENNNAELTLMLRDSVSNMDFESLNIFVDIEQDISMCTTLYHIKSL